MNAIILFGLAAALAFALGLGFLVELFSHIKEDMVHIVEGVFGLLFQHFEVALGHDRIRGYHDQEDLINITLEVFVRRPRHLS